MKTPILVFFLMSVSFLHAQTTKVAFSQKFSIKDPRLTQKTGPTILAGDFYYMMEADHQSMSFSYSAKLSRIKYGINLFKYDADMKEVRKIALHGREKQFGPFNPQMVLFNSKLLIFYYQVQEDNSIKLLLSVIDPETLNEIANKDLYTIAEKNVGIFTQEGLAEVENTRLNLCISPDGSKLLVVQPGNTNEIFSSVINSAIAVGKPIISKTVNLGGFHLQSSFIDNAENKYCSYTYVTGKFRKRGILVQNNKGQEKYMAFDIGQIPLKDKEPDNNSFQEIQLVYNTSQTPPEDNVLHFKASKDNATIYIYGNYYGNYMDEGVLLNTVDAGQLTIGSSRLFPYQEDIKEKIFKMGFGSKNEGAYTVNKANYSFNELEDGTIALTGYPTYNIYINNGPRGINGPQETIHIHEHHAGPVINIFIKSGNCHFSVLYRDLLDDGPGGCIAIAYKNSLVCIYNEIKKNVPVNETTNTTDKPNWMVLTQAVVNTDGSIVSQKEIAPNSPAGNYFTSACQAVSNNRYVIPIGRTRESMVKYYTELVQWVTLDIN